MTQELHQIITQNLQSKIDHFQNLINDLRASNNETKSSMGDKYETSREMLQQEIVRIQNQLNETLNQRDFFQKITVKPSETVVLGSYIETSMGNFCIAISLGEIEFQTKKIFLISQQTPLAQNLLGKKVLDNFEINGSFFQIHHID